VRTGGLHGDIAECALDLVHELLESFRCGCPLRLFSRELVRGLAYLLGSRIYLVSGGLLLLSGENGLLEHRRGRRHQLADVARLAGPLFRRHDRRIGLVLDAGDDRADGFGRAHRPLGELSHLRRYHGEALSRLAGARRLDRGVESEQVGLPGDVVDQLEDLPDLLRPLAQ
jgi:hypothetical protein